MVKPLEMGFLRERIVPKKSVFTRAFGVFCFGIPWGRCLAPKRRALPTAPHPDLFITNGIITHMSGKFKVFDAFFAAISIKMRYLILFFKPQLSAALPVVTKPLPSL